MLEGAGTRFGHRSPDSQRTGSSIHTEDRSPMNSSTADSAEAPVPPSAPPAAGAEGDYQMLRGALFGVGASLGYTAANIGLRYVSTANPVWVAFIKSLPTIALALPWLLIAASRDRSHWPRPRVVAMLIGGGIAGQIGGNICFQWSLDVIGLALAVPLTTGSLIIVGAIMARFLLGETISRRNLTACGIMILAVCLLSLEAPTALQAIRSTTGRGDWKLAMLGVAAACVPGIGYSLQNIAIRRALGNGTHIAAALLTVSTTGAIVAATWLQSTVGLVAIADATTSRMLSVMIIAGICNAAAFVAISEALRVTPIWFVYALSSSQVAMAAICGVWFFSEPLSVILIAGCLMTVFGLALMRGKAAGR